MANRATHEANIDAGLTFLITKAKHITANGEIFDYIDHINTALGITGGGEDLLTFTGALLSDNVDARTLFQEIETFVENLDATTEKTANKGAANGYAPLNGSTLIDSVYLPSYVDDVESYANQAAFPVTGETGKIYMAEDTNKLYRWSGAVYIEVSSDVMETVTTIGALINSATEKTTPVDADMIGLMDSAAANILKKLSWANVKATLLTYFNTQYLKLIPSAAEVDTVLDQTMGTGVEADLAKTSSDTYYAIKSNLSATTDPTATDDSASGYTTKSAWLNTITSDLWFCTSPIPSSAVWRKVEANEPIPAITNVVKEVRNTSGLTLNEGDPVYITGYHAGTDAPTVSFADSDSAATMPCFGLVLDSSIGNNANGEVVVLGRMDGFDTSAWSAGDALYVSGVGTTGNGLTSTQPIGSALIQKMCIVLRSHATLGSVEVFGAGRSNALPNLTQDKTWKGDANGVPQEVDFPAGGGLTWNDNDSDITLAVNNGYILTGNTDRVWTLPATFAIGDTIVGIARGRGLIRIATAASDRINYGQELGALSGFIQNINPKSSAGASMVVLVCSEANTTWAVQSFSGIWNDGNDIYPLAKVMSLGWQATFWSVSNAGIAFNSSGVTEYASEINQATTTFNVGSTYTRPTAYDAVYSWYADREAQVVRVFGAFDAGVTTGDTFEIHLCSANVAALNWDSGTAPTFTSLAKANIAGGTNARYVDFLYEGDIAAGDAFQLVINNKDAGTQTVRGHFHISLMY